MGCFAGCLVAAAIAASGASPSFAIFLALPGIAARTALHWRYHADAPAYPAFTMGSSLQP